MNKNSRPPFRAALDRYHLARSRADGQSGEKLFERALRRVDIALDALLAVPSPSLGAFGEKVRILEAEYGLDAQPRHIGAIYADVAVLAVIYADAIFQNWPTS